MGLISQETWDKFTEEEKEWIIQEYNSDAGEGHSMLGKLFGKENLQSEPKIRTWKDMEKEGFQVFDDYRGEDISNFLYSDYIELGNHCDCICLQGFNYNLDRESPDNKIIFKAIATLKIAKLIELGYGGMVTKEKWKDILITKYVIEPNPNGNKKFIISKKVGSYYNFIAFHTQRQAEEFISYPENEELVKQYYMV